eukprot:Sspe_Gene.95027::Locus_67361_Transcript_1_1_Confidence_1.000_Length_732::g.95027::m.95027
MPSFPLASLTGSSLGKRMPVTPLFHMAAGFPIDDDCASSMDETEYTPPSISNFSSSFPETEDSSDFSEADKSPGHSLCASWEEASSLQSLGAPAQACLDDSPASSTSVTPDSTPNSSPSMSCDGFKRSAFKKRSKPRLAPLCSTPARECNDFASISNPFESAKLRKAKSCEKFLNTLDDVSDAEDMETPVVVSTTPNIGSCLKSRNR